MSNCGPETLIPVSARKKQTKEFVQSCTNVKNPLVWLAIAVPALVRAWRRNARAEVS